MPLKPTPIIQRFLAIAFVFFSFGTLGQGCFKECFQELDNSPVPWPERNEAVLQALVGCEAPPFFATALDGKKLSLEACKGKVVVINFWFIGCAPCHAELPALNKLVAEYKDKPVVFISITRDPVLSVVEYLSKNPLHFSTIANGEEIIQRYCLIGGYPTSMVLDQRGKVSMITSGGAVDERAKTQAFDQLAPVINTLLR